MKFAKRSSVMGLICLFFLLGMIPPLLAADVGDNAGFNNPYNPIPDRDFRGESQLIADGWNPFYVEANTEPGSGNASKLRWMSSAQFASTFGGLDYHIEGDQSQSLWSSYEFEGGIYQQIEGLTPGQAYGFDIGMVTFWRGPGYPDSDGKMIKQVGIDPTGGTDPTSSAIVWSDPNDNDKAWIYMDVAATAQAATITLYAKVQAPENDSFNHTDLDMVYFDAGHIDVAPNAGLTISNNDTTINANWVGAAAPGWSIKGFEVQYQNQADGEWITLQSKEETNTNISFTGQAGQTYTVRVRAWQRTSEAYNSDIDMPGVWAEQQVILGNAVAGQVRNHLGFGLGSVKVSITGSVTSTLSQNGGDYVLPTGGPGVFDIIADDWDDLVAPPATSVTVPANGLARLDITLRPGGAQQALANNDFEVDLSNWNLSHSGAATVSLNSAHTGQRGLLITDTVEISQTSIVTGLRNPSLSFWRKNSAPFTVTLLAGAGPAQTKTLNPSGEWTQTLLEMANGAIYSGSIGVKFGYSGDAGANIFIDEVSLTAGLNRVLLPIIVKP